jgi:SAM-dependent methyltransferase
MVHRAHPGPSYGSRMDERVEVNRRRWDEMAALHETTYFTGTEAIDDELVAFELAELGDVAKQRVCHLQCHIGGNSIALARLGATIVGVDFSDVALDQARRRATEAGVDDRVQFVCATVDDAPAATGGDFDGVYTSWGALCWLPSVETWAAVVRELLRPGGWLYVADTHPQAAASRGPNYRYGGTVAIYGEDQGDYTDLDARFEHPEAWEWNHGIGEIVTALAGAGMRIRWLHEHTTIAWNLADEQLVQRPDGLWEQPGSTLPLSFSVRATKE